MAAESGDGCAATRAPGRDALDRARITGVSETLSVKVGAPPSVVVEPEDERQPPAWT